ncbi:hypothetical protein BN2497_289 [Janthinobacterium sp. CG23_2]|nr:hypothetical protein BN2497_289 [Janthinobacterium sp. CG23_2]CUU26542.1 hypothetical protein BN3177_289 [Janthinobacterium sp. CG23_2]
MPVIFSLLNQWLGHFSPAVEKDCGGHAKNPDGARLCQNNGAWNSVNFLTDGPV